MKYEKEIKNENRTSVTVREYSVTGTVAVDAFIIPNSLTVNNCFLESRRALNKKTCELNGVEYTDGTRFVEIWCVARESDNVCDHGITVEDSESGKKAYITPQISRLPVELFSGKKEGDVVTVKYQNTENDWNTKRDFIEDLVISMKLNQLDYRYQSFGTFEDCLGRLM